MIHNTLWFGSENNYPSAYPIPDLMRYLPLYYHKSRLFRELLNTQSEKVGNLNYAVQDVLDQYFVSTSTWGLALWETELGILSPLGQPDEQRRSVVLSKLRGTGTITAGIVKLVAESFNIGEVAVTEYNRNQLLHSFAGWTINEHAAVIGDYELRLTAMDGDQPSTYDQALKPGSQYTFSIDHNEGTVYIDSYDQAGDKTSLDGMTWDSADTLTWDEIAPLTFDDVSVSLNRIGGTKTFIVPDDSAYIRISLTSIDNATPGVYTFKNAMLMNGTAADMPRRFEPNKPYTVGIVFNRMRGIPANIKDIQTALRDLIPAHLSIEYTFLYTQISGLAGTTFGDIEAAGITYKQLETWEAT